MTATQDPALHPDLERIIREALEMNAGDLFLMTGEPVVWRINNRIERGVGDVLGSAQITEMAASAVGAKALEAVGHEAGEVYRSWALDGATNVRISVASSAGHHTMAIQLCAPETVDVETLKVPEPILRSVETMKGLIAFSGLTGSGRSTTALSVVDHINSRTPCHICTVEDPVSVRLVPKRALVQQRELGVDAPDAVSAIRAAITQGCDLLFLSEVRSLEQLEACIAAAETGHLVITVFNLQATPREIIMRMIEAFPEDQRRPIARALANVLSAVCSQILLPGLHGGRVPAYSYLLPGGQLRQAMAKGRDLLDLEPGPDGGISCSMEEGVARLVEQGLISEETARKALDQWTRPGCSG